MGVLVSFLVACVCTVASSAQTSGDLALGLSEFRKGNFTSAAALFARAEEAAPGATDALLYEGKAYIHLEQFTGEGGRCGVIFLGILLLATRFICLAMCCTGRAKPQRRWRRTQKRRNFRHP